MCRRGAQDIDHGFAYPRRPVQNQQPVQYRAGASRLSKHRKPLKRGTIYLLDEPTTGLDNAVARSLQKTLDKLAENATTICITHHLGDLKTSDDVIYLDAGHIVEHGSFEELMAAKGTFYDQVNARGDE